MHFLRFADICASGFARGKRVFIRADLNVPLNPSGEITEDTRIRASIPAIQMALDAGAAVMGSLMVRRIRVVSNRVDGDFLVSSGEWVLLEKGRLNKGEKKNSPERAKKLGSLCNICVHGSFGTAHRAKCSTHGIAETAPIACAGPLLPMKWTRLPKRSACRSPGRPKSGCTPLGAWRIQIVSR